MELVQLCAPYEQTSLAGILDCILKRLNVFLQELLLYNPPIGTAAAAFIGDPARRDLAGSGIAAVEDAYPKADKPFGTRCGYEKRLTFKADVDRVGSSLCRKLPKGAVMNRTLIFVAEDAHQLM